jgi:cold shock protein
LTHRIVVVSKQRKPFSLLANILRKRTILCFFPQKTTINLYFSSTVAEFLKKRLCLYKIIVFLNVKPALMQQNVLNMEKGTLKFFNEKKGYGFIVDDVTGKDVFVHHSGLVDKPANDDKVSFEIAEDQKGKKAVNVKIL